MKNSGCGPGFQEPGPYSFYVGKNRCGKIQQAAFRVSHRASKNLKNKETDPGFEPELP